MVALIGTRERLLQLIDIAEMAYRLYARTVAIKLRVIPTPQNHALNLVEHSLLRGKEIRSSAEDELTISSQLVSFQTQMTWPVLTAGTRARKDGTNTITFWDIRQNIKNTSKRYALGVTEKER